MLGNLTILRAGAWGALASLGFAPLYIVPLYVIGFGVFARSLSDVVDIKRALKYAASFAFFYLLAGHYWVVFALGVDWAKYWPIAVPVFVGVPLLFGWLYTAFIMLWWRCFRHYRLSLVLFGLCWWLAEQAKEHAFVGFPWNAPADVWTMQANGILHLASYIGAAGLGLLTIMGATWLGGWRSGQRVLPRVGLVVTAIALFFVVPEKVGLTEHEVVLVQPSIPQAIKTHPTYLAEIMGKLKFYSLNPNPPKDATIIWAEGALPMAVRVEEPYGAEESTTRGLQDYFAKITREQNTLLATAITFQGDVQNRKIFNSLMHVAPSGKIRHKVSKSHLLPLGEYIPFRWALPKLLADLAAGPIDMSPDHGPSTITANGVKWHVLICFESQFASLARRYPDADTILVVTNDSWFGNSSGPYQHFSASVLRAVETGKPVVRVANNGVSGIIDAHGHRHAQLGINVKDSIHGKLPRVLPVTFYTKYPYVGVGVILALLFAAVFYARRGRDFV